LSNETECQLNNDWSRKVRWDIGDDLSQFEFCELRKPAQLKSGDFKL